jgi:hypothetical protein
MKLLRQQQHYLPQLGWTAAAAFPATPAAWVYSELSWWGLRRSLPLHVAHMYYCSHYSVRFPYQLLQQGDVIVSSGFGMQLAAVCLHPWSVKEVHCTDVPPQTQHSCNPASGWKPLHLGQEPPVNSASSQKHLQSQTVIALLFASVAEHSRGKGSHILPYTATAHDFHISCSACGHIYMQHCPLRSR